MRRGLLRAAAAGALAMAVVPARAQAVSTADGAVPLRLRYGGDAAYGSIESLDAQGRPQGFQVDVMRELARGLGIEIEITLRPWAATEQAFRRGEVDVVAMIDTASRREWALFTHGHAAPALAMYHLKERPEPQGLAALAGLRVAVLSGEAMRATLSGALAGVPARYQPHADAAAAIAAVQQGQADVALLPRAYGDAVLDKGAAPEVITGRQGLRLQSYALAVAPGRQALRDRLQQGLDDLERSGRLEALRARWLVSREELAERREHESRSARQQAVTWALAAASGGALLVMAGLLRQRSRRIASERQRRHDAEELLERAFTHNPEPMLVVERGSAVIADANIALSRLLGVETGELIGQSLRDLRQHLDAQALQALAVPLQQDGGFEALPLALHTRGGAQRHCLVTASALSIGGATQVFCVLRDITEQLAADAELRLAYDGVVAELERARHQADEAMKARGQAEHLLQEFTRSVAHDLRAPVRAVQGFSGLLADRLKAGHLQEALTYSEHIARAAQRMNAMIGGLARLAQVARQPLQRMRVDMQAAAAETWALLVAAKGSPAVDFRLDPLPPVEADAALVLQVWQNLLENAWKYSAGVAAPKVRVDSHVERGRTWYRVTDNGAGFDMARAGQLFQPFQRMHTGREFEGTGVGLSVVRRIMEHHGGEVRLRSAPGVGTVAEFSFDPAA